MDGWITTRFEAGSKTGAHVRCTHHIFDAVLLLHVAPRAGHEMCDRAYIANERARLPDLYTQTRSAVLSVSVAVVRTDSPLAGVQGDESETCSRRWHLVFFIEIVDVCVCVPSLCVSHYVICAPSVLMCTYTYGPVDIDSIQSACVPERL